MRDKKVMKIIKQKADEKQIIDVSMLIKEKLNINQPLQEEQIKETKRFSFKALYVSFSLVLTASLVIVLTLLSGGQTIDLFDDSTFSDQVILSAISTVELVDMETELNTNSSTFMLLALEDEADYVENQIDEVLKYTEFMETFLNNPDQYQKQIKAVSYLGYKKMLSYEFFDMTGETNLYEFYYQQEINTKTSTYHIKGLLVTDQASYELTIDGIVDEKAFTINYQINDEQKINARYQMINDEHQLVLKRFNKEQIINESKISFSNKEEATLTFIKGEAKGIYRFQINDELPNGKKMRINYKIDEIDEGEIDLVIEEGTDHQYVIDIRPEGRPGTVVERERPIQPGGGNRPDHPRK